MNTYAKNDNRTLYCLIDEYLAGNIREKELCDEYYYSYNLEIEPDSLTEIEKRAFSKLAGVLERFSPFESDHNLDPRAFNNSEDVKSAAEEAKKLLG